MPLLRHLQGLAVCVLLVAWFPVIVPFFLLSFGGALLTPLCPLPLVYLLWYIYDRKTPYRAGRRFEWARNWAGWRHLASYFPISLHKTSDLDPKKGSYILVHHPHAVLGLTNFVHFGTEATGSGKLFPGITFSPLGLDINLHLPVLREWSLANGLGAVSAESILYKMTKMGPGQAVSIVVGGAAEAGLTDNDEPYRLKLKDRKGFVKMALKTGASMVPVFTFGEVDIFTVVKVPSGSLLDRFQKFVYRKFTFYPVIFYGNFGFIPYQKPIHTVVGSPIPVPVIAEPSQDDVDRYHRIYVEAMTKLFEENVEKYGDPTKKLQLL